MSTVTKIINNKPYTVRWYYEKILNNAFLILILAKRELKVKYSRTVIGIGWFFLQPLLIVVVYSIFFKHLIKINTGSIPYPSFVFSGLVLWNLFTGIIGKSSYALIESTDMISKVSFPKLIILISKIMPVVLECLVLLVFLFFFFFFNGQSAGLNILYSAFYFIQVVILSFAIGLFCSTVALKYRDIAHSIPFIFNFGIWLTPVFYPVSIVPDVYRSYVLILNPLAASIEGLRNSLFFNSGIPLSSFLFLLIYVFLLLLSIYYFIKFEKKIVENL